MSKPRRTWKQVDGVLLLDKPLHLSSNDALQKARRLFSAAKAGHTGTLDPLATGLLPICFGEATKFSADLLDADKAYVADVRLGQTTATGDAEGEVLQTRPVRVSAEQLAAVIPRFVGVISQVPPMYSALKRDGKPLYELARQGIEVEREAREVTILHLEASDFDGINFRLHVDCSKGTYIRTLAEDIGAALGCGAHLTALRRTRVGPLQLDQAATLADLEGVEEALRPARLLPLDALLRSLPAVELEGDDLQRFSHGNPVPASVEQGKARVYGDGQLQGVGEVREGKLWPYRLLRQKDN
ncbi:MAG TPA: tRNA pseudouridine(55) synthase TruB [Azospira sp.]|nr:tRNA pseudouridine(55) synthase TruB [Azospira sp.]